MATVGARDGREEPRCKGWGSGLALFVSHGWPLNADPLACASGQA